MLAGIFTEGNLAIGWLEVFTLSFSLWHEKIIDMATKTDAINAL